MTIIQSFLLGIIQGIAEFLPISSSGHLEIAQFCFGLEDMPILFDLFLHLATLAAVCIFFRHKIWALLKCFGRWITRREKNITDYANNDQDILCNNEKQGHETIIAIIISTIVTAVIGLVVDKFLPHFSLKLISFGFIITSVLLILSAKKQQSPTYIKETANPETSTKGITPKQAVIIGLMQGAGTIPGISRSGSTISAALFCNIDRKTAGDYSFIISIPAILGAFILELKDLGKLSSSISILPIVVGCLTSFFVGYGALTVLMKLIRKGKLQWFSLYLIPAGILGMIFL